MAISRLGTSGNWVELATSSPTSGSTVTFSSLPEYRYYKISYFDMDTSSTSSVFNLRLNNDSGSNYAYISIMDTDVSSDGVTTAIRLGLGSGGSAINHSGVILIEDANQPIKEIDFWHAGSNGDANNGKGFWNNTAKIDRVDFLLTGGPTFSSGTVKIYGRN